MAEVDIKELYAVSSSSVQSANGMSWSEDHKVSQISSTALHILGFKLHQNMKSKISNLFIVLLLFMCSSVVNCSNITDRVFGSVTDLLPAAFGDFNSDELTDLFAIRDNGKTVEIFLAADQEPLLRPHGLRCQFDHVITSVVPGDFDGDTHMDVLVTLNIDGNTNVYVYIAWGEDKHLNCSKDKPFVIMKDQPLALDYDHNMVLDLFGTDNEGKRMFWLFQKDRSPPKTEPLKNKDDNSFAELRVPHSHAFFDVNDDYAPDLFLSVVKGYEIWLQRKNYIGEESKYFYNRTISKPEGAIIGQSLFIDLELEGILQHIVPVCSDKACEKSTLVVYHKERWCNLNPNFKDSSGKIWTFVKPKNDDIYLNTITLRAGDFNMDGYPDLLVALRQGDIQKTYLLENIPCESKDSCDGLRRTFKVHWDAVSSMNKGTSMATFYDLYQDGVLDIILASNDRVQAFRNTLDYDANFVKVMVLGKERGTSLPGPRISYCTTTQEGKTRTAVATQLPQSAYFALGLPYSIFGLGRTPNFVDTLTVGVGGENREWTQIIPNSQMVVVPFPVSSPSKWRARLFVTPSKLILLSVAALTGTCCLIVAIIVGLYMKERREDRIEKLQEAHRFHFDAM